MRAGIRGRGVRRRAGVRAVLRGAAREPSDLTDMRTSYVPDIRRVARSAAIAVALVVAGCGEKARHTSQPSVPTTTPLTHPVAALPAALPPADVTVRLNPHRPALSVPHSFLGLSTEYWTLPFDERHVALFRRIVSLIHPRGDSPLVLRVGGDSSDHTFYVPRARRLPRWAFGLTPTIISNTARVVRAMRLKVILDLNLATGTPLLARNWVREAEAALPGGSILGFEIGNEPDRYNRGFWRRLALASEPFGRRVLAPNLGPSRYVTDFRLYARAVSSVAPRAALFGPAIENAGAGLPWVRALLDGPHPDLRVVTAHRYPYARCAFAGSPWYPTINRILSEAATHGMARSVRPDVGLARDARLRFRLTEFNSVTCGGVAGISDSFATALWAPDAAFELMRVGAQGINLHARQYAVNDPFTFDAAGLHTHPLLYGLILFARTLGPGAELLPLNVRAPGFPHVKVWAVRIRGARLHVLVINKGPRGAAVDLRMPTAGSASVERLRAPAATARTGVRLDGQWLNRSAEWQGTPLSEIVPPIAGRLRIVVPAYSAALVTARLAAGG